MSIFDKFDSKVNLDDIKKQMAEASENSYEEVPAGQYIAKIEKMELGVTKKDNRPMFKVQMRLVDSEGVEEQKFLSKYRKKPCIFFNRVVYGTKNDGLMIRGVLDWLNKIGFEQPIEFRGYADFEQVVMDCAEQVSSLEFAISYDPDDFNSVEINEVYAV